MIPHSPAATLVFLLLLAGCLGNSGSNSPTYTQSPTETSSSVPIPTPYPANESQAPVEVFFSTCHDAATSFQWPSTMSLGRYPPGWEPNFSQGGVSGISLEMVECDRLSWGPIERPLHLLFEMYEPFTASKNCTTLDGMDGVGHLFLLNSLWVDDQPSVDYLKGVYDLPVVYGDFNVTTTSQASGEVESETWSWNQPGQAASQVSYDSAHWADADNPSSLRIIWFNATMLRAYSGNNDNPV
ncbi:MAG: hypothetical protein ABR586_07190 [Thermoplasmatota archaeon]